MRATRIRSITAGMAAACLVLAGCSGGGSSSESPSPSAEVTETATESETATETSTALPPLEYEAPPQYPEGIEVDSAANAEVFLQFAIDTLNYAQRFNDVEAWEAISHPDCGFCNDMVGSITEHRDNRIRQTGVEISCQVVAVDISLKRGYFS